MKQYDTIPYYRGENHECIIFDKLDGSCLRFEFSHKRGFYKFGTRHEMIDTRTPPFNIAIDIFLNKYGDGLNKIFSSTKYKKDQSFVCFAEFLGEKSEYGWHDFDNDKFDIILIDVNVYKRGLVPPIQFVDDFGHTGIPKIIGKGRISYEFQDRVKKNEFGLKEGVICKSTINDKKYGNLFYCKMKTDEWLTTLKKRNPEAYQKELLEIKKCA